MNWSQLNISIAGLQQHYQRNDFSPRQLVEHLLNLEPDDTRHVWIERLTPAQLEPYLQALESRDPLSLPLYGIPFAIKDNIDLAGIDTTAGCDAFRYRASQHAHVVQRLIEGGAIPLGKTNLDQFATGLVGVRSPYGACRNAFNPEYISGGSSSGSAVATALGLVSFALGTDTAGSGRVPAAFNNLIGLKPSRGLISCNGVVPACQSLDCVSIFALSVDDAQNVLTVAVDFDPNDPYSRANVFDNGPRRYGLEQSPRVIGIPAATNLEFFGDSRARDLFAQALDRFRQLGHQLVEIDIAPLLQAARLLYQGPWVSERYLAIEALISQQPEALLPEIAEIIGAGSDFSALDSFKSAYQLQHYAQIKDRIFRDIDVLLTPTTPTCFTIAEVQNNPIQLNSQLGTYTNYMNLLDLAGVALPAGFLDTGVGFGITLQAPAFSDISLLSLANAYCEQSELTMGATGLAMARSQTDKPAHDRCVDLVVCGAHLEGMALNWQLTERGAVKQSLTTTSADYRLYAMNDGRPALIRDEAQGGQIEVEVWRLDKSEFGSFVADIPPPLGIGKVELADGRWLPSFIAESRAIHGAQEITELKGWRNYMSGRS
ncbi:MAG: allophanate hydrolase [Gammaproteobacteria bacterium]|nr:allophanate hydrolase [Gammaproteobacteria bacterium]